MATRYARSTDGNNADDGSTWALAKLDLAGIDAIDTAGDRIWLSDNHAESTAGAIAFSCAGTLASPSQVLCGDDAAEPPTALATTATVTTTGTSNITLTGCFYMYGVTFNCGTGAGAPTLGCHASGGLRQIYESCSFQMVCTATTARLACITDSNANAGVVIWKNCTMKFANASQFLIVRGVFRWNGGNLVAGTSAITTLIAYAGSNVGHAIDVLIENVDLSACASTVTLASSIPPGSSVIFRNCKLPASWSGALAGSVTQGSRVKMINCDSTDTNYRLWIDDYYGSIKQETTIVRSGGASDGTTPISWKMVSGSDAEYPHGYLESEEIVIWNDTTGSSKTATIEIVHDSQGAGTGSAFQDDEIWLKVQYLGDGSFPKGTEITDCKATVLATAADQDSSSESWTTTGLTTPVKQKLSVTFTPQEKGLIIARVVLAKASKTVYVDPELTIS